MAERGTTQQSAERIPIIDLAATHADLKPEIEAAVQRVLASGQYVGGPEVAALEREFAALCGVAHAVAVGSGTDALRFALLAVDAGGRGSGRPAAPGQGPGGARAAGAAAEVVTSPLTFIATTEAVSQAGAVPVFADVEPDTLTVDPAALERALTPRTRAIVPVHLYGQTADMDPILDLARRRGLSVVEDACQAHGAAYGKRPAGSMGDVGCFSFYPTKNLGACGEGGMVTTSSEAIADRIRRLRDHGQAEKYRHAEEGYNGRLDAVQAAILRVKLRRLDGWNDRRRALAQRYRAGLRPLEARGALALPGERAGARHVYHLFSVRVRGAATGTPARDRVRAALRERGIDTGIHYPIPLHLQPCYAWMGLGEGSFPVAEQAAREILSLPLYPEMTDAQVDRVCDALRDALAAG